MGDFLLGMVRWSANLALVFVCLAVVSAVMPYEGEVLSLGDSETHQKDQVIAAAAEAAEAQLGKDGSQPVSHATVEDKTAKQSGNSAVVGHGTEGTKSTNNGKYVDPVTKNMKAMGK